MRDFLTGAPQLPTRKPAFQAILQDFSTFLIQKPQPLAVFAFSLKSYNGTWSRIDFNGTTAYCSTQYLTTVRPSTMNDNNGAVVAGDVQETPATGSPRTSFDLRLHASPDTNSQVLCVIPAGFSVELMSRTSNGFSCVGYNGIVGYCASEYLVS